MRSAELRCVSAKGRSELSSKFFSGRACSHFFLFLARASMASADNPIGYVVVLKKDNQDGGSMPMTVPELVIGRRVTPLRA